MFSLVSFFLSLAVSFPLYVLEVFVMVVRLFGFCCCVRCNSTAYEHVCVCVDGMATASRSQCLRINLYACHSAQFHSSLVLQSVHSVRVYNIYTLDSCAQPCAVSFENYAGRRSLPVHHYEHTIHADVRRM